MSASYPSTREAEAKGWRLAWDTCRRGCSSIVHLPNKYKVLGSIPSTTNKGNMSMFYVLVHS